MQTSRGTISRRPPPPAAAPAWIRSRAAIGAGVVLVIALVWLLWPSKFAKVANLDSRGTNLIAFGDSLTAGYGAPAGEDYPSDLARLIEKPVINAGVSGDTTAAALARLDTDVLSQNPRIVIVGLGGNDFLRGVPIAETESNLRTIVGRITDAGAMVVLLEFQFPSINTDYAAMYERVANEKRSLLAGGVLKGIETNAALKSDEIHPNSRGYQLMADRIAAPLRKLIRRADATR